MRRSLEDDAVAFRVTGIVEADDAAGIGRDEMSAAYCSIRRLKIRYLPWRSAAAKLDGWLGWTYGDGRG